MTARKLRSQNHEEQREEGIQYELRRGAAGGIVPLSRGSTDRLGVRCSD